MEAAVVLTTIRGTENVRWARSGLIDLTLGAGFRHDSTNFNEGV